MILDMQYTLAVRCGIAPNDNMDAKSLLYFYSCYCKDLQEEKERQAMEKALKSRVASAMRSKVNVPVSRPRHRR
jgi:hypothetical protein